MGRWIRDQFDELVWEETTGGTCPECDGGLDQHVGQVACDPGWISEWKSGWRPPSWRDLAIAEWAWTEGR